jgi:hypothetical protein
MRSALFLSGADLKKELLRAYRDKKSKTGGVDIIKTGRFSKKGNEIKRYHRISGPGQTPSRLDGGYGKGIFYKVQSFNELLFGVKDEVYYAVYLEYGTKYKDGKVKMAARPGVANALKETLSKIKDNIESKVAKEII